MEQIQSFVDHYGYIAVLIGTFFEGETVLATAGFVAQRGILDLHFVILVALVGGFLGDQAFFYLGRFHGKRVLTRFPSLLDRAVKMDEMLHRYHTPLIVAVRFMYGFRIIGPVVLGMGRVSGLKFFVFNLLGASLWAVVVANVGYYFGAALQIVLADIKRFEVWLVVGLALIVATIWAVHRYRNHRKAQAGKSADHQ